MITLALTLALTMPPADDVRWNSLEVDGQPLLDYAIVTPDGFDATAAHPVLLALPPGSGDRDMVERGLQLYFAEEGARRGWVVVSPTAAEDAETWVPALLDAVASTMAVEADTFHMAGVSNGGRRAFAVAGLHAERFASLTVLPGMLPEGTRAATFAAIATLPTALFVGEQDADWRQAAESTVTSLRAVGAAHVDLDVLAGEGHVLDGALGSRVFDRLDALRADETVAAGVRAEVAAVLDDLHDAAAVADEDRYFDHYLPEAIFIGTDATERWTIEQFRAYAEGPFQRESAWTYEPLERHVVLSADHKTAWFDERLVNAKYGETRGSGVLHLRGDRWRIAQYVLSFAVPNDMAADVVEVIGRDGH